MSFKREGDDPSLLSKLQKRRIDELLGEGIPDDEAKLLSNGRLTCTVCNSVPIFDTLNMLMVHRSGKKHLAKLQKFESSKRELQHLIAVRQHHQFVTDGTTDIPIASSTASGFKLSKPYNPCVKKAKVRATDRKLCVNLEPSLQKFASPTDSFNRDLDTKMISPGLSADSSSKPSTSTWQVIAQKQLSGPVIHDRQLKCLCGPNRDLEESIVVPYQGKKYPASNKTSISTASPLVHQERGTQVQSQDKQYSQVSAILACSGLDVKSRVSQQSKFPSLQGPLPPSSSKPQMDRQGSQRLQPSPVKTSSVDQSALSQKLRQLQGSGWKRDWDGKWIKDENAEFDSDEEPPEIP